MFTGLLKSEIKKAESVANKYFNRCDCKVTGYAPRLHSTDYGCIWYEVTCEICFNYETRADRDAVIYVFMNDRRRSFAQIKNY
jgi:hypothetical protein